MSVLVDTPIWSLSLRRNPRLHSDQNAALLAEWSRLVKSGEALMLGVIRQELLSGIRESKLFHLLRENLAAFDDVPVTTIDHEIAAHCFNRCRAGGVSGSVVDMLICAVALRMDAPIFTTDADFQFYAKHLPIRLHVPASDS